MKVPIVILFISIWYILPEKLNAQKQHNSIAFSYDKKGRMTQRKLQVMVGGRIGNFDQKKDSAQRPFKVFPNPTNTSVNIEGPLPEHIDQGEVVLLNMSGQVLKTDKYTGQSKNLMVSDLNPGIYILEIRYSKDEKSVYKIIVNN